MAALGGGAALVLALGFLGGWQAKAMSAPPVLQAAPDRKSVV